MSNFKLNTPMNVFQKISAIVFLLIVTLFPACKKDFAPAAPYTTKQRSEGPVSVEEAKYTFANSRSTRAGDREYEITLDSVTPLWDAAVNSEYANTADILIVPIAPDSNRLPGGGANLIFFRTQDILLDYRMLVHIPDSI
jgi:hypothetical protein